MNNIPFPYKFTRRGKMREGSIFDIPGCCKKNCNSKQCQEFYSNLPNEEGLYICPFGFTVALTSIEETQVYLMGLHIVGHSNRRLLKKYLKDNDFSPLMTKEKFTSLINKHKAQYASYNKERKQITNELHEDEFLDKTVLIENTIHEIRTINREIKIYSEDLYRISEEGGGSNLNIINELSKKIYSSSQLMTIRLDTYDFGLRPNETFAKDMHPMVIHKKFVKSAKCLQSKAWANNVFIRWTGESYSEVNTSDIVEILPYIIIENGIKYSYPQKDITIEFSETEKTINVVITSLSLRPQEKDLSILFERGYRGENAKYLKEGQGIGLYLAHTICNFYNIEMEIHLGNNRISLDGYIYSDFIVNFTFKDIIKKHSLSIPT